MESPDPWEWNLEGKGLAASDESKIGVPRVFQEGWAMKPALLLSCDLQITGQPVWVTPSLSLAQGHAHPYMHVTCLKQRAHLQGKLCSWALCLSQGSCNAASLFNCYGGLKKKSNRLPTHAHRLGGLICTS